MDLLASLHFDTDKIADLHLPVLAVAFLIYIYSSCIIFQLTSLTLN